MTVSYLFLIALYPKEVVNIALIISSPFVQKRISSDDHILTIIYKYLLTSFHFIITMTNHSSSNLDYTSDLKNFELFYIIEGLDIQESWKLSKEALWLEEIRNCIVYAWNLKALKGFASMFMRLSICSFLLQEYTYLVLVLRQCWPYEMS